MAVKKKTKCYQVKNWTQYNKSLVNREKFYGDGAYEQWNIHEGPIECQLEPVIPPRRGSAQQMARRDEAGFSCSMVSGGT